MKIKHFIILLISASFISVPVIIQQNSANRNNTVICKEKIYEPVKEKIIFNAPEHLIKEKSSFNKIYILLNDRKVSVYKNPSKSIPPIDYISSAIEAYIIESTEEWYKISYKSNRYGYILKNNVTTDKEKALAKERKHISAMQATHSAFADKSQNSPERGQEVVDCAKKYLGVRYVYGGTSPAGFDCSGLVQYVCKSLGISVSRTAASQFSCGVAVNKDELIPGDLLFFAKNGRIHHVGIYAGDGMMIHAPQTGDVVKLSDFNTPYRQREFVGARRVF